MTRQGRDDRKAGGGSRPPTTAGADARISNRANNDECENPVNRCETTTSGAGSLACSAPAAEVEGAERGPRREGDSPRKPARFCGSGTSRTESNVIGSGRARTPSGGESPRKRFSAVRFGGELFPGPLELRRVQPFARFRRRGEAPSSATVGVVSYNPAHTGSDLVRFRSDLPFKCSADLSRAPQASTRSTRRGRRCVVQRHLRQRQSPGTSISLASRARFRLASILEGQKCPGVAETALIQRIRLFLSNPTEL